MGNLIDLTGKRFTRLLVIGRDTSYPPKKGAYWKCQCDCGNVVSVKSYSLIAGITKSCGCYNREVASKLMQKDITGKKFGRLTAKYNTGKRHGNCYLWHCVCECGNEVDVPTNSLTTGGTRSCGCLFHKDIAGQKFGRLTALHKTDKRKGSNVVWHCICECGNECDVPSSSLLQGVTKSCGCLRIEAIKEANTKWSSPEEKHLISSIFKNMLQRCYNPHDKNYHNYGARGITVCDEWRDDPASFAKWALLQGYTLDGDVSIERIDNDGPYAPWNCKWATPKEQGNNRRSNRHITIDGVSRTLSEWASIANIDPNSLWGESDSTIKQRLSSFIVERRKQVIPMDVVMDSFAELKRNVVTIANNDPYLRWAYGLD